MSAPSPAAAVIREQLAAIGQAMERIEAQLRLLDQDAAPSRERARPERYFLVLLDVYEHGVHGVDQDRFGAIGAAHGYDRRGLGGFFAGSRAPLKLGERVTLTAEGTRLLDRRLEGLAASA